MRRLVTALSIAIFLVMGSKTNLKAQYADWPETIRIQIDDYTSFEMVKVEAGYFEMGCSSKHLGECNKKELPRHGVYITNDYYIGKFEVTQKVWNTVMGNIPRFQGYQGWPEGQPGTGSNYPAYGVTFSRCVEFCEKLSRMTGYKFRLPTEAEWEYAARGGNKTSNYIYSGSDDIYKVAWFYWLNKYGDNLGNSDIYFHPVGKLLPNELGIYDMSGNAWEWCIDIYEDYNSDTQINPIGYSSNSDCHVIRGGSSSRGSDGCRVSFRTGTTGAGIDNDAGFRIVLPIEQN